MERTITVIDSRSQRKYVLRSMAETLGELKVDLEEAGVADLYDMVFKEGTTRAEYSDDDSVLPQEVVYRGRVTNDLAFMIVEPRKKIKSGMGEPYTRADLYRIIKENNLQDSVYNITGSNFTRVSNDVLYEIIEDYLGSEDEEDDSYDDTYDDNCDAEDLNNRIRNVAIVVNKIINALDEAEIITPYFASECLDLLNDECAGLPENQPFEEVIEEGVESKYSDKDLLSMFN